MDGATILSSLESRCYYVEDGGLGDTFFQMNCSDLTQRQGTGIQNLVVGITVVMGLQLVPNMKFRKGNATPP